MNSWLNTSCLSLVADPSVVVLIKLTLTEFSAWKVDLTEQIMKTLQQGQQRQVRSAERCFHESTELQQESSQDKAHYVRVTVTVDVPQLHIVFTALIVSCLLYALPAWGGFLSSGLLNKIDSILRKAHKFGYTTEVLKVTDMLQNADNKLFHSCSDLVTAFVHYYPTSK